MRRLRRVVAERSVSLRRRFEKIAGGIGSENADMSSEMSVRNTHAENPRVPAQG